MVDLHDEDRVGEQHVDDGVVGDQVPLAFGQAALALQAAPRQHLAQVQAEWLEQTQVGVEERRHRVAMQHAEVVALEEGVDDQLPVHLALDLARLVVVVAGQAEGRELGVEFPQEALGIDLQALRADAGLHPQHAVAFGQRQRRQAVGGLVHTGKVALVGNATQLAFEAVGPAVVGADEVLLPTAAFGQACTTVPADIVEGPRPAVLATNHQDRDAAEVVGEVVARLRDLVGQAHQQRVLAEQQRRLARQALRAGIGTHRVEADRVGQIRGAGVYVGECLAHQRHLFVAVHGFSRCICGNAMLVCQTYAR